MVIYISKILKKVPWVYRVCVYILSKVIYVVRRFRFNRRINRIGSIPLIYSPDTSSLNIILITVDCLRYPNLSYNGYHRKTTPFFDSFDNRFSLFSASCWTYPATASILTGLYPHNHGAFINGKIKHFDDRNAFGRLKDEVITLPEIFHLAGYQIYFVAANAPALWAMKGRVIPHKEIGESRAQDIFADVTQWLLKNKGPYFVYLHLDDLHEPLNPPKDFQNYFGVVKNLSAIDRWAFGKSEEQQGEQFEEYKKNRILFYDNTLRYIDSAIENFYLQLKELNLLDNTLFMIAADHGEEFWEHTSMEASSFYDQRGYYGIDHGHSVFNEIIQVPLLMSYTGLPKTSSSNLLSTVDITPTLLDLAGIKVPFKFDGMSIFHNNNRRTLLCEGAGVGYEKKAVIFDKYKLFYSQDDNIEWVFDLEADPEELHPLGHSKLAQDMINRLAGFYSAEK